MLDNFTIYENGQVVKPPAAVRIGHNALNALVNVSEAVGRSFAQTLGECATAITLDVCDAREGTSLRAEWNAQRKAERVAQVAGHYGLTARDAEGKYVSL